MKMRVVWSGLVASAIVLAAGTSISGPPGIVNQLLDFDPTTSVLSGIPQVKGQSNALSYLHQPTTIHLAANPFAYTPPDPCRGLAEAWNRTIDYDTKHHVTSTFLFEVLLSVMSDFRCSASVNTVTSGTLPPIVDITPVPAP